MAITCPNCNFAGNPNNAEKCQLCNSPFGQTARNIPSTAYEASIPTAEPPQNQLAGRITWIETTTENIEFNWYRFLSQVILFLMFLPLLFVIFAISFALWISLAILGFRTLSSAISPFNVANSINSLGILLAVVFPRVPQRNQVPAVRLTVQGSEGERAVLIRGELVSGTFRRGDQVELNGRWRNGTLIMQSGYNRTLHTALELRRDYWWVVFIGLLGLIMFLGVLFLVNYR
jgi:hypothetical protein